ncbi:MAG: NYN domain-containing protein [Phycisphaerales bacterium]|nr:NYN domain-containing protein [Phycisphaerales bacterium]MCI0631232.1 NYN domain-containing protein [Phycisphaerales bacterium]MCI0677107.1 NYN domain-containing protein [Phycisphaerales bacterium]
MPLLIDTYNVLHTVGVLPPDLAGIDLRGLIDLLHNSRYGRDKITLACDGAPQPGDDQPKLPPESPFAIRYSGKGRSADDLISQIVHASSAPRKLTVVSSDHQVLRTARKRRCPTLSAQEFLGQLVNDALAGHQQQAPPAKPIAGQLSEKQIERWISVFKLDPQMLDIPRGAAIADARRDSVAPGPPESSEPPELSIAKSDSTPIQPLSSDGLPTDLISEAEELWKQHNPVPARPKAPESG